jgi:hypothetical protein
VSLFRRILNLFSRSAVERKIDAELRSHVEMRTADNIAAGMAPEQARREALLKFGNPLLIKEKVAAVDAALSLDSLFRDVHYAGRRLRKSPAFAITVIATLAFGIGANTAIFSIVDAVLLRPLPYKNANRLVVVWQTDGAHRGTGAWFEPYREFEEWQRGSRSFEKLSAMSWATADTTLVWRGKPVGLLALPASTDFFSMLGAQAQNRQDIQPARLEKSMHIGPRLSLLAAKAGAPSDIAGQILTVDRIPCAVVGVMPKTVHVLPKEANAWSLITPASASAQKPWDSMTGVFGLLKPGVTRAQAEAELNAMEQRILPQAPASLSLLTSAVPVVLKLQDNFTWLAGRNLRSGLWVLSGAVSLILLMTCLNVANLLLGRATEDARGMAIRTALGSGRARLIRQMLTESLMLAFCGTGAGHTPGHADASLVPCCEPGRLAAGQWCLPRLAGPSVRSIAGRWLGHRLWAVSRLEGVPGRPELCPQQQPARHRRRRFRPAHISDIGGDADCAVIHALCRRGIAGGKPVADGVDPLGLSHESCADGDHPSSPGTLS